MLALDEAIEALVLVLGPALLAAAVVVVVPTNGLDMLAEEYLLRSR